jgi:mandelamide amidase
MRDSKTIPPGAALNPRWRELNAFTYLHAGFDPRAAGIASAGRDVPGPARPLAGYSLAIKDNIEVAGMPCTCGTPALRTYVPRVDAPAIARLRCAGAQIVGKANMHELAYGITSNNAAFGPVRNAFDPSCFAGGSSGGTAVAIAAGVVRAGLGTDTGGSSRIPAALNGIVGFRPSIGRYPMDGVARISPTRDAIGPMARDVGDVALLDAVLSGDMTARLAAIEVRGLRIGLPEQHFQESLHADMSRTLERVVASLTDAGVVFVGADLPNVAALNAAVGLPIVLHETKTSLQSYLRDTGLPVSLQQLHEMIASPDVKELVGLAIDGHVSQQDYERALNVERPRLQQLYRDYFAMHGVEAILFPTTPLPACPIEGSDQTVAFGGGRVPTFATFIRNTDPASNAGIPSISLPAGARSQHLPLGIELDGPEGADRRLLTVAGAISAVLSASFEASP